MAKNSFENSTPSRPAKGKSEGITPSWSHFETAENDPHDSWDKDAFEKSLKNDKTTKVETQKDNLNSPDALNKPVDKVKEGDVSSIKSKKVVYGGARSKLVKAQEQAVAEIKEKQSGTSSADKSEPTLSSVDIAKFQTSGAAKGSLIGGGAWSTAPELNVAPAELKTSEKSQSQQNDTNKKETLNKSDAHVEELGNEPAGPFSKEAEANRAKSKEPLTIDGKTGERIEKIPNETFEKAKAEWKESRNRAHKLEAEYNQKYQQHIQSQSMIWRGVRRAFGFQPKLNPELEALQGASLIARREYQESAKKLSAAKDIKTRTKFSSITKTPQEYGGRDAVMARYQRMLANHLVTGVYKKRLETQTTAIDEAWSKSKVLRPTLNVLRHKAVAYPLLLGAAVFNPVVLAAGLGVGMGTYKGLDMTWVASSKNKLAKAKSSLGSDFLEKSFIESDREMEYLTYDVETRKALTKTASTIAGVSAGFTASGLASGINQIPDGSSHLTDIPEPKLDGVPPDLSAQTPKQMGDLSVMEEMQALADQKNNLPPREMGDLSVMEQMQELANNRGNIEFTDIPESKLEGVPPDFEVKGDMRLTDIPDPKLEGVPPDLEAGPESLDIKHTVTKGENAWNIMEGRGPDANPVGGKSVFLQEMDLPMGERQALLDDAVKYLEQNPESAKEIGAVKSDGDIHKIYPGEVLNITKFDDLLRNIYEGNDPGAVTEVIEGNGEEYTEDNFSEEPHEPEDGVTDMNDYTLREALDLSKDVANNDPEAIARLEELGWDPDAFADMLGSLSQRGSEQQVDLDKMTVGEYLNNSKKVFDNSPPANNSSIPDATPYGLDKPEPEPGTIVRDASVAATEAPGQSLDSYVRSIEQPKNGILDTLFGIGKPNVAGTFDQLKDLSVGEIKEMVASDSVPAEMTEEGFDRWVAEMNKVAANDNERFGDVIARAANSRTA